MRDVHKLAVKNLRHADDRLTLGVPFARSFTKELPFVTEAPGSSVLISTTSSSFASCFSICSKICSSPLATIVILVYRGSAVTPEEKLSILYPLRLKRPEIYLSLPDYSQPKAITPVFSYKTLPYIASFLLKLISDNNNIRFFCQSSVKSKHQFSPESTGAYLLSDKNSATLVIYKFNERGRLPMTKASKNIRPRFLLFEYCLLQGGYWAYFAPSMHFLQCFCLPKASQAHKSALPLHSEISLASFCSLFLRESQIPPNVFQSTD